MFLSRPPVTPNPLVLACKLDHASVGVAPKIEIFLCRDRCLCHTVNGTMLACSLWYSDVGLVEDVLQLWGSQANPFLEECLVLCELTVVDGSMSGIPNKGHPALPPYPLTPGGVMCRCTACTMRRPV